MSGIKYLGEEELKELGEEESRISKEIEKLKDKEKDAELKHQSEGAKVTLRMEELKRELELMDVAWKAKELEHRTESLERKGKIEDLERQLAEMGEGAKSNSNLEQKGTPIQRDGVQHSNSTDDSKFIPVKSNRVLEAKVEAICEVAQETNCGWTKAMATVDPDVDQDKTGEKRVEKGKQATSNQVDTSSREMPANVDNPHRQKTNSQQGYSSIRIPGMDPNMTTLALRYYRELDIPDDAAELEFLESDQEELSEFACGLELTLEDEDIEQIKLISRFYYLIFSKGGLVEDIDKAIDRAEESAAATAIDTQDHKSCLKNLIVMLIKKYEHTASINDLDRAILRAEEMVTITPLSDPDRKLQILDLVTMKARRARQIGSQEELEEAMLFLRMNAPDAGRDSEDVEEVSRGRAKQYMMKFKRSGNLNDLCVAIETGEEAVMATSHDHLERADVLNNLAICYQTRYSMASSFDDLRKAIKLSEEAVATAMKTMARNNPDKASMLSNLALFLRLRFEHTGDIRDINMAIKRGEEAMATVLYNHPEKAMILASLSSAYEAKFERVGDIEDINLAIKRGTEAIAAIPHNHPERGSILAGLAVSFQNRFEKSGNLDDIATTVRMNEELVAATPRDDPRKTSYLCNLVASLQIKLNRTGSFDDLQRIIKAAEECEKATPYGHPHKIRMLDSLSSSLRLRFDQTNNLDDLQMAIKKLEQAIAVTPRGYSILVTPENRLDMGSMLNRLAWLFWIKFGQTKNPQDLRTSIKRSEEAVAATPHNHTERANRLAILVVTLKAKFDQTGNLEDLQMAIKKADEAIKSMPDDSPDKASILSDFGQLLQARFERSGNLDDIYRAIKVDEESLEAMVGESPDPERALVLQNLAFSFLSKFKQTGDLDDINAAVKRNEEAVAETSDRLDKAQRLNNLVLILSAKFDRMGNLDDIQMAVKRAEEAVAEVPDNHPDRSISCNNLATCLRIRSDHTSNLDDLNSAIYLGKEAVAAAPDSHPDKASRISSLATSLRSRFEWTGNIDDINDSIELSVKAVAIVPGDHPEKEAIITDLGVSLRDRFRRTGDLDDLHTAINKVEEAVATVSDNNFSKRPMISTLHNLAIFLHARFERTGNLEDLQMAIRRAEEAVAQATVGEYLGKITILSALAGFLSARFHRTNDPKDLQIAIEKAEEVVAATPKTHSLRANRLGNLSLFLYVRFQHTNNLEDLQMSIKMAEEAAAAVSDDHQQSIVALANLSALLHARSSLSKDLEDLQAAIVKSEQALALTPHDHPNRASTLKNLAGALYNRFELTSEPSDFERALSILQEATNLSHALPRYRILSAEQGVHLLAMKGMWAEAARMGETAVELLSLITPRQLKQQDQQHALSEFMGLASIAATAAIEAGESSYRVVQLLELGRGVITGLRFGMRSNLSELRAEHSELAKRFERLRDVLDSPSSSGGLDSAAINSAPAYSRGKNQRYDAALTPLQDANNRYNAGLELEKTINEIRGLPGFKNFLHPPQADELMAAASLGPVVLINVSLYRCDALLIEKQEIRSIHLPNLDQSDIRKYADLIRSIRSTPWLSSDTISEIFQMLEWLWDVAVDPILTELGFHNPISNEDDDWPRIWWIPTGQLSLLPLHAAGYHSTGSSNTTLDRVVSSYSSSVKALIYSRQNSLATSNSGEALLVSMDKTPGQSDLRFSKEEVNRLENLLPNYISITKLGRPQKKTILDHLNTCSIFHFAGHGISDSADPSKSSLLVSDWQSDPLTVEDLIKLNLRQKLNSPLLAYLSACSTSNSDVKGLQDEAIHLVTACQLAGFQHVVGSLWEVSDRYSVDTAEEIYTVIRDRGVVDGKGVSLGVHRATRRLRDTTSRADQGRSAESQITGSEVNKEGSEERSFEDTENEKRGVRNAKILKMTGYDEEGEERSNPFIWAAYIHVGP
ncbi:hypothetical protein TWF694_003745 [Orbilia ellipsospora]|uniref:CHAT domain-containing protein n=1 Tax=Orbilia ellipsospora TaxID=2528407 RepID=A0AAV9WZG2_9PEZI